MNSKKRRADERTVELGLAPNRSRAQALIMVGHVLRHRANQDPPWQPVLKSGEFVGAEEVLVLHAEALHQDVGRGAQKLRGAIDSFCLHGKLAGCDALDVGSSTGGFTQVLLENQVKKVVALDVGTNQLHERLRQDSRVISMENQHVLKTTPEELQSRGVPHAFGCIVIDVSFIGVVPVLEHVWHWLLPQGFLIFLIKPQFEVGLGNTVRGVVKDEVKRQEVLDRVTRAAKNLNHANWLGVAESCILGGEGNREFFGCLVKE